MDPVSNIQARLHQITEALARETDPEKRANLYAERGRLERQLIPAMDLRARALPQFSRL